MMSFKYSPIACFISTWFGLSFYSLAMADTAEVAELETVEVIGNHRSELHQTLNEVEIQRLPKGNGTINGLLRKNSAIRFSINNNQSIKAGEITPESVSFYGEPYYNNRILIDGLSNNDIINPGYSNAGFNSIENSFESGANLYLTPSNPEVFQIDNSLVRNIRVYDSNIPAKYNRFTGGVIDSELKEAELEKPSGKISYRTTRDRWTYFHFSDDEVEQIAYNDALNNIQPEFKKHIYNLTVNQPVSNTTALLFSYNRTQSFIPENHWLLGQRLEEQRLAETYLLKATHHISDSHKLNATVLYSPHKNIYYADNVKDGRYATSGGGYRFTLNSERFIDNFALMKTTLDYSYQKNQVKYESDNYRYVWLGNIANTSLNWCSSLLSKNGIPYCSFSREGGLGELNSQTKIWTLKQDYELLPLESNIGKHQMNIGWEVNVAQAGSKRPNEARFYYNTDRRAGISREQWENRSIPVPLDCTECLPNEQFQTMYIRYPKYQGNAQINSYTAYIADEWKSTDWTLHPGINLNYDSFLKNLNAAPRFTFKWSLLGEERLSLLGGLNRYYSTAILAHALRENIPPDELYYRQAGNQAYSLLDYNRWARYENRKSLKTPYSDEANIGFIVRLGTQLLNAKYIYRHGQRQFASYTDSHNPILLPNGRAVKATVMDNSGETRSNSVSLVLKQLEPIKIGLLEIDYQIGLNFQKNKSNSLSGYLNSDEIGENSVTDDIQTRGRYYIYNENRYDNFNEMRGLLPALNFNAPWNAFLELNTDLPQYRFKWTHYINYQPGYIAYRFKQGICGETILSEACLADGDKASLFTQTKYKNAVTVDWSFIRDIPLFKSTTLTLNLDVINVFNAKIATHGNRKLLATTSKDNGSYQLGRQYWFNISYHW